MSAGRAGTVTSVTRTALAKSAFFTVPRRIRELDKSGSHDTLQANRSGKNACSTSTRYSWVLPVVAGPEGDGSAASRVTLTRLSGGTFVVASRTTRSGLAGKRFRSQS